MKQTNLFNRISRMLALVLALVMMFTALPLNVFASENDQDTAQDPKLEVTVYDQKNNLVKDTNVEVEIYEGGDCRTSEVKSTEVLQTNDEGVAEITIPGGYTQEKQYVITRVFDVLADQTEHDYEMTTQYYSVGSQKWIAPKQENCGKTFFDMDRQSRCIITLPVSTFEFKAGNEVLATKVERTVRANEEVSVKAEEVVEKNDAKYVFKNWDGENTDPTIIASTTESENHVANYEKTEEIFNLKYVSGAKTVTEKKIGIPVELLKVERPQWPHGPQAPLNDVNKKIKDYLKKQDCFKQFDQDGKRYTPNEKPEGEVKIDVNRKSIEIKCKEEELVTINHVLRYTLQDNDNNATHGQIVQEIETEPQVVVKEKGPEEDKNYINKYKLNGYVNPEIHEKKDNTVTIRYWAKLVEVRYMNNGRQFGETEKVLIPYQDELTENKAKEFATKIDENNNVTIDNTVYRASDVNVEFSEQRANNKATKATVTVNLKEQIKVNHYLYYTKEKQTLYKSEMVDKKNTRNLKDYAMENVTLHDGDLAPKMVNGEVNIYYWAQEVIFRPTYAGEKVDETYVLLPYNPSKDSIFTANLNDYKEICEENGFNESVEYGDQTFVLSDESNVELAGKDEAVDYDRYNTAILNLVYKVAETPSEDDNAVELLLGSYERNSYNLAEFKEFADSKLNERFNNEAQTAETNVEISNSDWVVDAEYTQANRNQYLLTRLVDVDNTRYIAKIYFKVTTNTNTNTNTTPSRRYRRTSTNTETIVDENVAAGVNTNGSGTTDKDVTRAEFTNLVAELFVPEDNGKGKLFRDITGSVFKNVIELMTKFGLTKGYSEDEFGPNDLITNEQVYTILVRGLLTTKQIEPSTAEEVDNQLAEVADKDKISFWAKDYVAMALKNGVAKLDSNNKVNPLETAKQSKVTEILSRYKSMFKFSK